jgi:hypothetical protein
MDSLDRDYTAGIFNNPEPPCLSLYQATHRVHPDNEQDPIRFRNLVKELEHSLRRDYSSRDIRDLIEPFHKLADDRAFWNSTLTGLAALGAPGFFRAYRLRRAVPELAIVADSFHLKPLLRILQSADDYQLLGVSREKICFFEGNRDALDEVELDPVVPGSPADLPGGEAKEFQSLGMDLLPRQCGITLQRRIEIRPGGERGDPLFPRRRSRDPGTLFAAIEVAAIAGGVAGKPDSLPADQPQSFSHL